MVYRDQRGDCPRCRGVLAADPRPDETRLSCMACSGVFLDNDSLRSRYQELMPQLQAPRTAIPLEPLSCPLCKTPMRRFSVEVLSGSVALDRCDQHGIWFDDPELEHLLSALR